MFWNTHKDKTERATERRGKYNNKPQEKTYNNINNNNNNNNNKYLFQVTKLMHTSLIL